MTKLTMAIEGDTDIVVTRRFSAPPEAVYRAHIDPALVQRWMTGPDGWTMPSCQLEAKAGGRIRYDWANQAGHSFYLTGEFVSLEPHHRIVHIERMHLPDPTPDATVETRFDSDGSGTMMTMRIMAPNADVRAAMLESGMEHGMDAGYARLDHLVS